MKISTLIQLLEDHLREQGDLDVEVRNLAGNFSTPDCVGLDNKIVIIDA